MIPGNSPLLRWPSRTWEETKTTLRQLVHLPRGWDDDDADPISRDLVQSAIDMIGELALSHREDDFGYRASGLEGDVLLPQDPPHDVYPLSGGAIVLEWQYGGQRRPIVRIFIDRPGIASVMLSTDDREPVTVKITWPVPDAVPGCRDSYDNVGSQTSGGYRAIGPDEYSLAA